MEPSTRYRPLARLTPQPRTARMLIGLGALSLAVALAAAILRCYPAGGPMLLGAVAATPYLLFAAPAGLLLMLIARQWIGVATAAVVTAAALLTQLGLYTSTDPPAQGHPLTVMTANLRLGEADPAAVVDAVRRHRVEVLMLEEVTPAELSRLAGAGLASELPYRAAQPRADAGGTALWSRYPLAAVRYPSGFGFAMVVATVAVPGLPRPPTAVALHMTGPVPAAQAWQRDIRRLRGLLGALPAGAPVIVGGDFNATHDTVQFRELLRGGYADAADEAGAGYTRTFPAGRWYPPLIAIDHVLTRGGAVATAVRTVTVRGSDHRALLARVDVPRSG